MQGTLTLALTLTLTLTQGAFAPGAVGISLIKGIEFKDSKPILISDLLAAEMKKARPLSTLHPLPCHTPHATPLRMPTCTHLHAHPHPRPHPSPSRPHQGPNAPDVDMSVLMGANVANEVAKGDFAEATVGCTDLAIGAKWVAVFNTPDFKVDPVVDVAGAELCGALKNVEP